VCLLQCELPLAKVSIGTGALTAVVTFSVIASQWIGIRMGGVKKGDDDEADATKGPSAGVIAAFVIWIIAVLGTLTAWAYLGYCVLASFIKHRQFPNVNSCDATLLDPLFYVTSVVLTVFIVGFIAMAIELVISCYYKDQGEPLGGVCWGFFS
jgi:hypothetical protein